MPSHAAREAGSDSKANGGRLYEIWAKEKAHLPLTKDMIDAIDKHLRDVPLR